MSKQIHIEKLRQIITLDANTGQLYWLARPPEMFSDNGGGGRAASARAWNAKNAGSAAFCLMSNGYRGGTIFGEHAYAHQVAFAITHGRWPSGPIDHINGNRSDNRPENLRECSPSENSRNAARSNRNRSGVVGVCWHKAAGKWSAEITVNKSKEFLGLFDDLKAATEARLSAEKRLGFHANHGRTLVYSKVSKGGRK